MRCSTVPLRCTGQLLSRAFVVLLRKSIPQKINLLTAAELGVKQGKMDIEQVSEILKKARALFETRGSEIDSVCFGNFKKITDNYNRRRRRISKLGLSFQTKGSQTSRSEEFPI